MYHLVAYIAASMPCLTCRWCICRSAGPNQQITMVVGRYEVVVKVRQMTLQQLIMDVEALEKPREALMVRVRRE